MSAAMAIYYRHPRSQARPWLDGRLGWLHRVADKWWAWPPSSPRKKGGEGGRILNPNEAAMLLAGGDDERSALRGKMSDKQSADAPLYGGTDTALIHARRELRRVIQGDPFAW